MAASQRQIWQHRSEEHTSELQSLRHLVCRLLLEKEKDNIQVYDADVAHGEQSLCTLGHDYAHTADEKSVRSSFMDVFSLMRCFFIFFFFNDPATPEIYPLSLHDAFPICSDGPLSAPVARAPRCAESSACPARALGVDRKSTRLNSSHLGISYAVFCL